MLQVVEAAALASAQSAPLGRLSQVLGLLAEVAWAALAVAPLLAPGGVAAAPSGYSVSGDAYGAQITDARMHSYA